jgi:hypothetical protein
MNAVVCSSLMCDECGLYLVIHRDNNSREVFAEHEQNSCSNSNKVVKLHTVKLKELKLWQLARFIRRFYASHTA